MAYIKVKSGYLTGSSPGSSESNNGGLRMYWELRCYTVAESPTIMNKSYSCAAGSYKLYYKLQGWYGITTSSRYRLCQRTNTSNTSYVRLRNGSKNLWTMTGQDVNYAVRCPTFGDNNPSNTWYNVADASNSDYRVYPEGLLSVTEGETLSLNLDYAIAIWYSSNYSANVTVTSSSTSVSVSGAKFSLSVSATNSVVTVNRTSSSGGAATGNLSNGATIYIGDKLKITFTANSGYTINTHTVNGSAFTSGATHTVSGNVSVVSSATLTTFTLSISAGTGSSITVKRSGTTLSNGATITQGDVLTITFSASSGYTISTHTVNGSTFTSGNTHTVSGNVSVVATATTSPSMASASSGYIGQENTITVTRYNSSWTHTVTASLLNRSETIATKSTSTSLSWTPALATYAPLMTSSMSTTVTLTCQTYNGNTLVGTTTSTFAISLRAADVKPTITVSVSDGTNNYDTYGAYVATKSTFVVTATPSFKYNATQKTLAITANGSSYSSSPATTGAIQSAANNTITAKVTDSRSQTSDAATQTVTVLSYANPSVTINIGRCDQDGTANDSGAYMNVTVAYDISALNNRNTKSIVIGYKKTSDSSYTNETITPSEYSGTVSRIYAADTSYVYDVQASVTDAFGTSTISRQLTAGAVLPINFQAGGMGVGIGAVSSRNKSVELGVDWEMYFGDETFQQHAQRLYDTRGIAIPSNADLNDYYTFGSYYSSGSDVSATLTNTPITGANFRLEVISSGSPNGNNYCLQFVWSSSTNGIWSRRRHAGVWGTWVRFLNTATDGYNSGDSISITKNAYLSGYLTNSKQNIYFTIPLTKPVFASGASLSISSLTVRHVGGGYLNDGSLPSGATVETLINSIGSIGIIIRNSTGFDGTNNTPVAVTIAGTLTFS